MAAGIEADKSPLLGDINLPAENLPQNVVAARQSLFGDIGHRHQLDRAALGRQGAGGCPRASAAKTNQSQLNRIILARMDGGRRRCQ